MGCCGAEWPERSLQPQPRTSGRQETAASPGSHGAAEQKLWRKRRLRESSRDANAMEKLSVGSGAGAASLSCSDEGKVSAELLSGSFSPHQYLALSEKPFHEVSAKPAPNQPGSRWLAEREALSGKQSCRNQEDICFHSHNANLQLEVPGCLVSSAGAELCNHFTTVWSRWK